uniref:Uncharacterized protein n=1 Tax=viral metagenome TaxID=1070528 RepID=A0A6C0JSN2_9ZZZZ
MTPDQDTMIINCMVAVTIVGLGISVIATVVCSRFLHIVNPIRQNPEGDYYFAIKMV